MGRRSRTPSTTTSEERAFFRGANRAGGLEGGMTNGAGHSGPGFLKPISTLRRPLESVDLATREPALAAYERSDVCVVPAAGVIGEAMVSLVLAQAMLEKFGGDSLAETKRNYEATWSRCGDSDPCPGTNDDLSDCQVR